MLGQEWGVMPPLAQMIVMQRYAGVDNNAADNSARQALGTVHSFVLNTGLHLYTACTKERFIGLLWIRVKLRSGSVLACLGNHCKICAHRENLMHHSPSGKNIVHYNGETSCACGKGTLRRE